MVVRGFFSGTTDTPQDLEAAADIAREYEEWKVWLGLRGRVALARMWGGDVAAGAAMLEDPELLAVVRDVLTRGWTRSWSGAERCSSPRSSRRRSTCCRW